MSKRRTRRKRRQARAGLKFGRSAVPRHMNKSGRTGGVHKKRTPAKSHEPYVAAAARPITTAARCTKCGAGPGELHHHETERT